MGSVFYLFWIFIAFIGASAFGILAISLLIKYGSAMFAVLARNQGPADEVIEPEPAFKQYFFHKAWTDYRSIVELGTKASWDLLDRVLQLSYRVERYFFPGANMLVIGAAAGVVAGGALLLFVRLVHLVLVLGVCIVAMTLAYLCRLLEYGSMLWRQIFMVCPHAGCYRRIALPIYYCPTCSSQHKQLIPGSYGTLRRRCQCGQLLPTLFLLGRNRLPSICPHEHCGRPLSTATGVARNLHFPLVGGPTAGKSSLLMATMVELAQQAAAGVIKLELPEKKDERLFAASKAAFASGQLIAKTAEYSPSAFLATLVDSRHRRAAVYAYDAAGELFQGTDQLHRQEYYSYIHGIMLVIDPYSLPQARQEGDDVAEPLRASSEQPDAVYGRMVETLRGFSGQTGQLEHPLAVVLTKTDALTGSAKLQGGDTGRGRDEASAAVKLWLEQHGAGNLVRTIDKDFTDVKYFACSALGRMPDDSSRPFVPVGVLRPFAWLVGHYGLRIDSERKPSRAQAQDQAVLAE